VGTADIAQGLVWLSGRAKLDFLTTAAGEAA